MTRSLFSKRLVPFACSALFCLSTVISTPAQTSGVGNITGTLTDASGAAVANAPVVVLDTDTGVSRTLSTNGDGSYSASFLQPGHYEVILGGGSFGKVDRKNLVLTVGQVLTIDATLSAASVSTEVVVTADSPILDTQKTEVSQTFDSNLLTNLPVATRNWSAFVLNTPNVVQDGGSGLVSFHGISGLYNQNYVDGSNNNQMLFSEARGRSSGAPYVYSIDSIKEFQAETSNYSVEFGQAAGGQVNAITKSGTNAIHGDLFYLLRYPDLNALDPYSKFQALHNNGVSFLLTQPIHQQNQFGGSVGGPIIKDRLFYFFTYDGFRKVGRVLYSNSNVISTTGSLGYTTNNTATPNQCPVVGTAGYYSSVNAAGVGTPKTTGITAAQCTSAITFLQGLSSAAPGRFQKQNLFFPRLDYHINSRNDAFVDYNFVDFDSSYGYSSSNTFSNSSPSTNAPTSYHERFLVAGLTTQVGAAAVNQIHFQYGRDLETAGANAPGPSISTGIVTFGMPNALPRIAEPDEHRIQFTDVFSITKGHHTFKFGGDINNVHEVMINLFQGGGIYSYSGTNNNVNFQSYVQDAFAGQAGNTDPFAGYHYTTFVQTVDVINTAAGTQGKDDFYMNMVDGFAEDNWKISPTFTLTAGVRYDIQITPSPQYLTPPSFINPLVYGNPFPTYSSTIKNTSRVQPRVGFSWQAHPGAVVRGGYGVFSALNQGSTYYADRVENGIVQINYNYSGCGATNVLSPTNTNTKPTVSCATVPTAGSVLQFPNVPFQITGPSLSGSLHPTGGTAPAVNGPAVAGAQSFHGLDPNFVPPYAHEMDLSVEQALPGKMSLSVGYVGTRGMRLPVFIDANLLGQTPHGLRTYNVQDINNTVTKQLTVPVYLPTDRINTSIATYNTGFSKANTWYNSLAATVRRPFSNGLEVIANYTWAKGTDTGQVQGSSGTFYGGDPPLDPNNQKLENGLSDTDIRNRFTLSFVYQPHLLESNKLVKHFVDDWTFSGSEIASQGQPIFLSMAGTVYAGSTSPTSYGADGGIFGGAMSSGSGSPTTGRPPQIGRNSIVGPGFNDFDFRLSRNIPIHEKIYMQFSADAFNLLNHQIITSVVGTHSQYLNVGSTSVGTVTDTCVATSVPTGSTLQGCIAPNSNLSTGTVSQQLNAFKADQRHQQRSLHGSADAVQREALLLTHNPHEERPRIEASIRGRLFARADFAGSERNGAPGTIRTCDLQLRRLTLYPAELRARTLSVARSHPHPHAAQTESENPNHAPAPRRPTCLLLQPLRCRCPCAPRSAARPDGAETRLLEGPSQPARQSLRHPERQGRHHRLQLPAHARPRHHGQCRSLQPGLAHGRKPGHHAQDRRQPADRHPQRSRRHLYPVHAAQRVRLAPHRQQAEWPVGHRVRPEAGSRPHPHDRQDRRLAAREHDHQLRAHLRRRDRAPHQVGEDRRICACEGQINSWRGVRAVFTGREDRAPRAASPSPTTPAPWPR